MVIEEPVTLCFHCGDRCDNEPIEAQNKHFCCHGCRAVYELLEQSELQCYYDSPELKPLKIDDELAILRKFRFLEQEEVQQSLLRFHDEKKSIVRFSLPRIHCSSCIYLLEHLPKLDQRIFRSEVNFLKKEITITFDNSLTLPSLAVLLASLGYPPEVNMSHLDAEKGVRKSNQLGIKIAVAGFCFGNSMLISLPDYLDANFQFEIVFPQLFGWINLVLSLPVVLYAAREYYSSAWKGLRYGFLNIDVPITLGIFTLFLRSAFEILFESGPGYMDSLNGLVFFLLLGKWYQGKSYQALSFERDYKSYFPVTVTRKMNDNEEQVLLKELKPGDEVILHNLELIPGDGRVVAGLGNLDYSFVTGESEPVEAKVGSRVFAGGRQVGGELLVVLDREINSSEITQLWNGSEFSDGEQKYNPIINRVSQYFTSIILLLALGTGIYWWNVKPTLLWDAVAAVLIVACPCALALAMPFGLGHGMRILGRQGFYLKNAGVIERLSKIRALIFDKTGTLTRNDPSTISFVGDELIERDLQWLFSVCSNSAHPLSKLIVRELESSAVKCPLDSFEEVIGQGIYAKVANVGIRIGSAEWLGIAPQKGLQETRVYLEIDHVMKGYFRLRAAYREGIFETLSELKEHYPLHLLSGDSPSEKLNLNAYFNSLSFEQKPHDKLEYVQQITEPSLMIGDGLNDAGALRAADVGMSVCEDIHQFSPACDALIHADQITGIGRILSFSRMVMIVIIAAFIISFLYNIIGLSFAVSGRLTPLVSAILMPISSITVVGFITLSVNYIGRIKFKKPLTDA